MPSATRLEQEPPRRPRPRPPPGTGHRRRGVEGRRGSARRRGLRSDVDRARWLRESQRQVRRDRIRILQGPRPSLLREEAERRRRRDVVRRDDRPLHARALQSRGAGSGRGWQLHVAARRRIPEREWMAVFPFFRIDVCRS